MSPLDEYIKQLDTLAIEGSHLMIDLARFKIALEVLVSPKKIGHLPKYTPSSWWENSWKLSLCGVDLLAREIRPVYEGVKQTATIEEFPSALPVFVWYQGDQGNAKIQEALMDDFEKFGKLNEIEKGYTIEVLEAKVLVPGKEWEWMSLARHVHGNIAGKLFSSFEEQYSDFIKYSGSMFDATVYDASVLKMTLKLPTPQPLELPVLT